MTVEQSAAPWDDRPDRSSRDRRLLGNPDSLPANYKWMALFISTLGMLMATIDSSIVRISLPDIFRGIGIDPLEPGNTFYLLWMILGFLVVTLGRMGDIYGRVRIYNFGFAVFTFWVNCRDHPDSVEMAEHDRVDVLDGKTSGVQGSDHRCLMSDRLGTGAEGGVSGTTRVNDDGPITRFDHPGGLTHQDVTLGGGPVSASPRNRVDVVWGESDDIGIKWHVEVGDTSDAGTADHMGDHGSTVPGRFRLRSDSHAPPVTAITPAPSRVRSEEPLEGHRS
jgi:hypothetical protein